MNNTIMNNDESNLIIWVNFISQTFTQYVMGVTLFMGNVGSLFDFLVFSQPNLRKSPCSLYFIASSLSQFFTFNFALLTRMLHYGYNIRPINAFLWFCKFRQYLVYISVAIPRYLIILASIDRYFACSRDALRRQWSSQKIASRLIIGNIIFWFLIYIHIPIFFSNGSGQCVAQKGVYDLFFSIHVVIDSGILPVSLLCIFGWLTLKSIRQIERRTQPMATDSISRRSVVLTGGMSRKDIQIIKLLLYQLGFFIILNMPMPCLLLYQVSTINQAKSPLRITVETCLGNMVHCFVYIEFSCTFIINVSTSQLFRTELKQFIQTKLFRRGRRQRLSTVATTTRQH